MSIKGKATEIDESGKPHHLIGTQVDITPWVKAEEVLLYAKAAADESNRLKSEMLKNVTHELRTPLTAAIGFSDLLLCDGNEKDENTFKEHIKCINQSGQDLLTIVNRILDFTNIENGFMAPFNCNQSI
ncbi:histidine kinase dimerization/phospho-acceptor domain-containing protein [Methanolobus sp.]|uniref:sensor histidine kinase n=1 Tax=Methanolobus sp. TaxID=1874737 RepID=UPI0025F6A8C9|nr:histidine kinase dimerization/phospho-acceptor domain-containing protein [Methanolobus sp.]